MATQIDEDENHAKMLRGELYIAFTPRLHAARKRCHYACNRFNNTGEVDRRELVRLWRECVVLTSCLLNLTYTQHHQR